MFDSLGNKILMFQGIINKKSLVEAYLLLNLAESMMKFYNFNNANLENDFLANVQPIGIYVQIFHWYHNVHRSNHLHRNISLFQ